MNKEQLERANKLSQEISRVARIISNFNSPFKHHASYLLQVMDDNQDFFNDKKIVDKYTEALTKSLIIRMRKLQKEFDKL